MAEKKRKTTNRGFAIYDEFTDSYGNHVRVQQSSNITPDATVTVNYWTLDCLLDWVFHHMDGEDWSCQTHYEELRAVMPDESTSDGGTAGEGA